MQEPIAYASAVAMIGPLESLQLQLLVVVFSLVPKN